MDPFSLVVPEVLLVFRRPCCLETLSSALKITTKSIQLEPKNANCFAFTAKFNLNPHAMGIWSSVKMKWSSYRYRFVPWMAVNLKNKYPRSVSKNDDKLVLDQTVIHDLLLFLTILNQRMTGLQNHQPTALEALQVMQEVLGFSIQRKVSKVITAGTGVFVCNGRVKRGALVALYPGTIYLVWEPMLFPSIANPYIFRCLDGTHIDGKDRGVSRSIFKSCVSRDMCGPHQTADLTWLTTHPSNPLNVGQYVNNQSPDFPCNVAYQEFDLPLAQVPWPLRRYLPNIYFGSNREDRTDDLLRMVALVATRDITAGEELFSTYYTVVHDESSDNSIGRS